MEKSFVGSEKAFRRTENQNEFIERETFGCQHPTRGNFWPNGREFLAQRGAIAGAGNESGRDGTIVKFRE